MIALVGGLGYIGSHIAREFDRLKIDYIIIDNQPKTSAISLTNESIICDIRDFSSLQSIFLERKIDLVIHLAGLKNARESNSKRELYWENNVQGTKNLLSAMNDGGCSKIIFSSTAAVYKELPGSRVSFLESSEIAPASYYGVSKVLAENEIQLFAETNGITAIIFRFFNVVGANFPSPIQSIEGSITANLIDAVRDGREFSIYGDTYPTRDGTAIRDYVHIDDIVSAHVCALNSLETLNESVRIFNLGSSEGYSVLELIHEMSDICGYEVRYSVAEFNEFDLAYAVANNSAAKRALDWAPLKSIKDICFDSLKYFH